MLRNKQHGSDINADLSEFRLTFRIFLYRNMFLNLILGLGFSYYRTAFSHRDSGFSKVDIIGQQIN